MISFKCRNCAAEVSVDRSGMLFCEYCGSKEAFSDRELQDYKNFRYQMLNYLRGLNERDEDAKETVEGLWTMAEKIFLKTAAGTDVEIKYIYSQETEDYTMYVARQTVIYVFSKAQKEKVKALEKGLSLISFPAADMKGLDRSFPKITGKYELAEDAVMMTFSRRENVFPLGMFGALEPEHAAWIVSRLENICCVLEYSDVVHGAINVNHVFIDPFNHEAVLYGGWWSAGTKERAQQKNADLLAVREIADYVMGMKRDSMPKEFYTFIHEKPTVDAYQDFERWDRVIEEGFGGRRFVQLQL